MLAITQTLCLLALLLSATSIDAIESSPITGAPKFTQPMEAKKNLFDAPDISIVPGITPPPTTILSLEYSDNDDGTVTHAITGLTWKRCAEGQSWDGNSKSCTGNAFTFTFEQTKPLMSNFAGKSDWRLPTIAELKTIVEREKLNPTIHSAAFPNTSSHLFWSSSVPASELIGAWVVDFFYGGNFAGNKDTKSSQVRLVRSGRLLDASGQFTHTSTFIDNGNGTITHKATGLTWQRCAVGQVWNDKTCLGQSVTYTHEQALKLSSSLAEQTDWRLPTANELASIVEYSTFNPAINTAVFPGMDKGSLFWSSSFNSKGKWAVDFTVGDDDLVENKDSTFLIRFVRGKQSYDPMRYENAVYDDTNKLANIQDVQLQSQHFQVQLELQTNGLLTLKTAKPNSWQQHNQPAQYDEATETLTIPRVVINGKYFKALLKNIGNYTFQLAQFEELK